MSAGYAAQLHRLHGLHEMLCSWQRAAAMLEAGGISEEDYDKWRYHYPEFDKTQNYVKVPTQDLF